MCRLFALAGTIEINEKTIDYLEAFQKLAQTGNLPVGMKLPQGHKDGWGIVVYKNQKIVLLEKEPEDALRSVKYKNTLEKILNINPEVVIAHLKKIVSGEKNIYNTHPFVKDNYSFCRNGTISREDIVKIPFDENVKGTTGTERFFFYLLNLIKNKEHVDAETIRHAFQEAVDFVKKNLNYTALNSLFCNGEFLWALREVNLKNPLVKKYKMLSYYSLYRKKVIKKEGWQYIVCSEKIDQSNKWRAFKNHELWEIDLKNGKEFSLFI